MTGRGASRRAALAARELERVDTLLRNFLNSTRARCAVLVDRAGHLVWSVGEVSFDRTGFASLAAADFAASGQLARMLGEDDFASLYHRGDDGSMYMADVAGQAILAVLFDGRTTLGMVRLGARSAVPEITTLFTGALAQPASRTLLENGWLGEAEDTIDRLFVD